MGRHKNSVQSSYLRLKADCSYFQSETNSHENRFFLCHQLKTRALSLAELRAMLFLWLSSSLSLSFPTSFWTVFPPSDTYIHNTHMGTCKYTYVCRYIHFYASNRDITWQYESMDGDWVNLVVLFVPRMLNLDYGSAFTYN